MPTTAEYPVPLFRGDEDSPVDCAVSSGSRGADPVSALRQVIDPSTKEGRVRHWRLWYAAPKHQRSLIGLPPCYTCGSPADGTYPDGSPRFEHHHAREEQESNP